MPRKSNQPPARRQQADTEAPAIFAQKTTTRVATPPSLGEASVNQKTAKRSHPDDTSAPKTTTKQQTILELLGQPEERRSTRS